MLQPANSILQLLKLSAIFIKHKWREHNGCNAYLAQIIKRGDTVFEIGDTSEDDLIYMRQLVGSNGRAIIFPYSTSSQAKANELNKLMQWKNVIVKTLPTTPPADEVIAGMPIMFTSAAMGTTVASIKEFLWKKQAGKKSYNDIDTYCLENDVWPNFIRVNAPGRELEVIQGMMGTLEPCKTRLMLHCHERNGGRKRIMQLFQILKEAGYHGSFMLDTLRIPLRNFDFDIYQNPRSDFYCSTFVFE